jgi:hypothetical protein
VDESDHMRNVLEFTSFDVLHLVVGDYSKSSTYDGGGPNTRDGEGA